MFKKMMRNLKNDRRKITFVTIELVTYRTFQTTKMCK